MNTVIEGKNEANKAKDELMDNIGAVDASEKLSVIVTGSFFYL